MVLYCMALYGVARILAGCWARSLGVGRLDIGVGGQDGDEKHHHHNDDHHDDDEEQHHPNHGCQDGDKDHHVGEPKHSPFDHLYSELVA